MAVEKTLRDEIALGTPEENIQLTFSSAAELHAFCVELFDDPLLPVPDGHLDLLKLVMRAKATLRYMYADAVLAERQASALKPRV